jgi:hypothetical protein
VKLHDTVSFTSQTVWGAVATYGFIHKVTYLRWSYWMWLHPQGNLSGLKLLDVASSLRKPIWAEVTGCGSIHKEIYLRWSYQVWFRPQGNPSEVKLPGVVSSTRKPIWGEVTGCVSSTSQQISVKNGNTTTTKYHPKEPVPFVNWVIKTNN